MSPNKIEKLTLSQEALIPVYREKWREIALFTKPLDRQKATSAVKAAYGAIGKKEPEIRFCDSPYAGLKTVRSQALSRLERRSQLGSRLSYQLWEQLERQLESQLRSQLENLLSYQLWSQLEEQPWNQRNQLGRRLENQLERQLERQLASQLNGQLYNYIQLLVWVCYGSFFDFCINVLNCVHVQKKWEAFQLLVTNCGWIFPFKKTCIVCSRPIKLSVDSQERLHAEGSPAMKFADGYSLYSYHGVTLPEKYGEIHPHQWRAQWLLEEDNAEIRLSVIGHRSLVIGHCQQFFPSTDRLDRSPFSVIGYR